MSPAVRGSTLPPSEVYVSRCTRVNTTTVWGLCLLLFTVELESSSHLVNNLYQTSGIYRSHPVYFTKYVHPVIVFCMYTWYGAHKCTSKTGTRKLVPDLGTENTSRINERNFKKVIRGDKRYGQAWALGGSPPNFPGVLQTSTSDSLLYPT